MTESSAQATLPDQQLWKPAEGRQDARRARWVRKKHTRSAVKCTQVLQSQTQCATCKNAGVSTGHPCRAVVQLVCNMSNLRASRWRQGSQAQHQQHVEVLSAVYVSDIRVICVHAYLPHQQSMSRLSAQQHCISVKQSQARHQVVLTFTHSHAHH